MITNHSYHLVLGYRLGLRAEVKDHKEVERVGLIALPDFSDERVRLASMRVDLLELRVDLLELFGQFSEELFSRVDGSLLVRVLV
jgi:hypothetical protein